MRDAQAAVDRAQAELDNANATLADVQSKLVVAQSAKDSADAVAKLDAAKQAVKDAESAKVAADVELANAKVAKDTADASVTAAQQKVDEAQAKLDSADAQLKQGAIGFFRAMGADSAIEIIQNCTYKDYTEVGNSLDATSLDNMLAAIPYMKSINEYRKSVGLSELQVTYKLIAAAIVNANYSDVKFGHSMQFDTSENLAWNYGTDPKPQWVDQEKAFFDQAVQELYGVTGLIGKDAVDFYKSHSGIESYVNQHFKVAGYPATVGHYLHVISPEIGYMGMAVCSKGTMNGWKTDSFDTANLGWAGSGWNMNPMSVDEYEQKLTSYINGLKNAKSALDAAKADLASKKQAAAGAATTVQQKQVAVDSAQAGVDAAKQGVADAQRAVDAAKVDVAAKQQGVTDAQTELDAAKSDLDAANAAVDTAKSTVQQKQVAFDAANAVVTAAQTKLDSAKADTEAKQQADATARALADAQRAVDTGVAADRITGSQTDLEDAQSNLDILTGLAAKLAEAQQREQDAVKAVNDTKAALDAAKADTIAAESLVSAAEQAKAQADAKLSKLNSIDAGAAIAFGHDANADDALNALFAAAVEARAKVAPAKAILDMV